MTIESLSFCESVTASSLSPWCVRKLTSAGKKLGGGVDTESLCGRVRLGSGWDLDVEFSVNHPMFCTKCLKRYIQQREKKVDGRPKSEIDWWQRR